MPLTRIGIIGAGPNAAGHAKYYAQHADRAKLVAVADPDGARAAALAAETGCRAVADYRQFLSDVDAVVVSSPNFLHREHAVACAQAGKHVYCEKPMGLSYADAVAIADAVRAAGVRSCVGFSPRFSGNIQTLGRYVREGRIGDVVSIWSRRLMYLDPAKAVGWRKDPAKSGGLLLEINVHELDWMMWAAGDVESVYARFSSIEKASPRANDHIWITLNFAKGAVGTHEGSWISATPNFYKGVHGTKGGATTDEWGNKLLFNAIGTNREEVATLDPTFDLSGHFLDCIDSGADPVADATWGLKVMRVAEAAFTSAATGQVCRVSDVMV